MDSRTLKFSWSWLFIACFLFSCARAPLVGPENALRRSASPELSDDLPMAPLLEAVSGQIQFLEKQANRAPFLLGDQTYSFEEYLQGLKRFVELGKTSPDTQAFFKAVRSEFDFYQVYGQKDWGDVFITSYFEPVIEGSRKPTSKFPQALYSAPKDMIALNLSLFNPKLSNERQMRGRLEGSRLVPYFSREEIDSRQALRGLGLELCYVDPIDAFFLQIQGSGTVHFEDGQELRLVYADKNGWNYESISKFLKSQIPPDQMNLHTIELYLRTLSPQDLQKILNLNPSYVFFKPSQESALTSLGVPATGGRTIATDSRYFPKGALAFLEFEKPVFHSPEERVPTQLENVSRFVLDQDIGGAITGGGRLDLFWGKGADAKRYAGAMKNRGRLYYLGPKRLR